MNQFNTSPYLMIFGLILSTLCLIQVIESAPESSPGTQMAKQEHLFGMTGVKRSAPRTYSFGLGKRGPEELNEAELNDVAAGDDDMDPMERFLETMDAEPIKRGLNENRIPSPRILTRGKPTSHMYSFGLGKRASGLGRIFSFPAPSYLGDIKRRYSFGLGKK